MFMFKIVFHNDNYSEETFSGNYSTLSEATDNWSELEEYASRICLESYNDTTYSLYIVDNNGVVFVDYNTMYNVITPNYDDVSFDPEEDLPF